MARFEITGLKKRPYRDLSGGQQQRVLLARALCAGSRVLLLDEPVSGLDPLAAAQFYELLARLHQKEHKTLMMVSHDMASALRYAQKIVHVRDNGTVLTETPDTYRDSQAGRHFLHGEGQK